MKIFSLIIGMVAALVGAVCIAIAIWQFVTGEIRSVFSSGLWLWIGLHAVFAFASLIFFGLASPAPKELEQTGD